MFSPVTICWELNKFVDTNNSKMLCFDNQLFKTRCFEYLVYFVYDIILKDFFNFKTISCSVYDYVYKLRVILMFNTPTNIYDLHNL